MLVQDQLAVIHPGGCLVYNHRTEEEQRLEFFQWIWPKIIRGCDRLESACRQGFDGFDIGQAAMLHAISYMDFRAKFYSAGDPLHPDFDCFDGRPNLLAWWEDALQRPSVTSHYNVDFEGDDSVEYCQQNVREVLVAQGQQGTS